MESIQNKIAERGLTILKGFKEVDDILRKSHKIELKAACGIVFHEGKILLGLSNADDDRKGKWCFAGGGIEENEDCISAAIRETYEEMGIQTTSIIPTILYHVTKPMVGFCLLKTERPDEIVLNEEFDDYGWFEINDLPEDIMSINKDILSLVNYETLE